MDCERDTCTTTEKCRCYALLGKGVPNDTQICAYKRGDAYFACEASCCKGGCPGQCTGVISKPPYGVIDKISNTEIDVQRTLLWIGLIIATLLVVSTIALF